MRVFLSWCGDRSKTVAQALRDWLPDVIQGIQPWMSASDIEAGSRWNRRVQDELSTTKFGVICVTQTNQTAPWILFEAGALAKTIDDSFVCPYLIDLEPSQLTQGPLTQFQAKRANEEDTFSLVRSMNSAMKESGLPEEKLERAFKRWWPDLASALAEIPEETTKVTRRQPEDVLDEILIAVRELVRTARESEWHQELAYKGWVPLKKVALGGIREHLEELVKQPSAKERLEGTLNRYIDQMSPSQLATILRQEPEEHLDQTKSPTPTTEVDDEKKR